MNHYETLGITRNATQEEIAGTFRSLAKQYHPDHNNAPDAKNRFIRIYEAYSILNDKKKRKVYDTLVFNKTENVKKETEQVKAYTQWQETAKKEGEHYSKTTYNEFEKKILKIAGIFSITLRVLLFVFIGLMFLGLYTGKNYIEPVHKVLEFIFSRLP